MIESYPVHFECANPILRVEDMAAAVRYYVEVLGFKQADWGTEYFTSVNRDRAGIYLCSGNQRNVGAWAWIGVEDGERRQGAAPAEELSMGAGDPRGRSGRQHTAYGFGAKGGSPWDYWKE